MYWLGRVKGLMVAPVWLVLLCALACSRPADVRSDDEAAPADPHPVPFHTASGDPANGTDPGDSSTVRSGGRKPEIGIPFHDGQNLPIGTLLTVQLEHAVSAGIPGTNPTFDAVIEEPVVIGGTALVPRGASVSGRVESAHASRVDRNRGYVRLALDSIRIAGSDLPIRTSSLFARGNAGETQAQSDARTPIRLEKGRRLTFRLAEPLYLASRGPVTSR